MPDSGDENDSRTASVGMQRNQTTSNNSSRRSSQERSRKKQKRMGDRDVRDFVPQGGTFSANPLEVDPESMSSSRSQDSEGPAGLDGNRESATGTAERADNSSEGNSQFDKVNDRYWRSRSESGSARGEDGEISSDDSDIDEDTSSLSGSTHSGDSVDSEEADDSIMLNIGSRNQDSRNGEPPAQGSEYDPEPRRIIEEGLLNGGGSDTFDGAADSQHAHSKEEALRRFSSKYPTAPSSLVDLDREDFEIQAKYLHFDRDINDVNLDLPIACTECFQEGHLAEVCPSKEASSTPPPIRSNY